MRKQRGLKRYYRNLERQNDLDKVIDINFNDTRTWQKNEHFHFDRKGYGDTSFKKRKPHLNKLFRHFSLFVEKAKFLTAAFQLYAIILDFNSSSDALFLHTPNLGNSQFLFRVEDLSTVSTLTNNALNDYIDKLDGYEKLYGCAEQAFCLLYIKGVGQPF